MSRSISLFLLLAGFMVTGIFLGTTSGTQIISQALDIAENKLDASPNSADPNQPPALISLSPSPKDYARAGSIITWSAKASDPDGDAMLFSFWLNGPSTGNVWKAMTNWTESGFWNWTTTSTDIGNNIIEVRLRDGHHAALDGWDAKLSAEYGIEDKGNQKPTVISLKPDKVSPQPQGTRVAWTANGKDIDGDTVLYQFWLKGPSTDEVWSPMTEWTTKNAWSWNSSPSATGMYSIEVWVRDGYHIGPEGNDDFQRASFVIRQFVP